MKKILVTYALEAEKGDIQLPGHKLVFCATGVGKTASALETYRAILREKPDLVLNIGTAGTLQHQVGDIFVCSHFVDRDLEKIACLGVPFRLDFSDEIEKIWGISAPGCVSTGDTFQSDAEVSVSDVVVDVFEMEAFAGAQACKLVGLPFLSVKYVTDVIGQNSIKHWEDKLHEAKDGLVVFLKTLL
jgi:adenosylhomocysteine nucleosidase